MKSLIDRMPATYLVAAVYLLLLPFAVSTAKAQEGTMTIKGKIIVPPGIATQAQAEINSSDGESMSIRIERNGRFWVNAPLGDMYVLSFRMPGCVTKNIVVDATQAVDPVSDRVKKVELDVVLHADNGDGTVRYLRPVGKIALHRCNGCMSVQYDYRIVSLSVFTAEFPGDQ